MQKPCFETLVMSNNPYHHLSPLGNYEFTSASYPQHGSDLSSGLNVRNIGTTGSASMVGRTSEAGAAYAEQQNVNDSFPCKLHQMLSEIEEQGLDSIVSWQPHGRSFAVHRRKDFVDHIMPSYFRMSKFASFQRQLNLYGFSRFTAGRDKGGYYHELFLRGQRDLCLDILRRKVKGTGARKPAAPETEPNFYLLPYMPPSNTQKSAVAASQMPSTNNTGLASMLNSSLHLPPHHTTAPAASASGAPAHSLVSMAALAPREMFANIFDPIAPSTRTSLTAGEYQLHSQQTSAMERRLSLLSSQFQADRRFSLFSNPFEQFQPSALEPIRLPHLHQQQQQLQQQQQFLQRPLQDETETSFDAAIAALMRMDPPNT